MTDHRPHPRAARCPGHPLRRTGLVRARGRAEAHQGGPGRRHSFLFQPSSGLCSFPAVFHQSPAVFSFPPNAERRPPQVLRAPSERPAPRAGPQVCRGPAQQRPRETPLMTPGLSWILAIVFDSKVESRNPPAPLEELDSARPLAADTRNRPPCRARETESKGRLRVDESKLSQLKMKVSARRARLPVALSIHSASFW